MQIKIRYESHPFLFEVDANQSASSYFRRIFETLKGQS